MPVNHWRIQLPPNICGCHMAVSSPSKNLRTSLGPSSYDKGWINHRGGCRLSYCYVTLRQGLFTRGLLLCHTGYIYLAGEVAGGDDAVRGGDGAAPPPTALPPASAAGAAAAGPPAPGAHSTNKQIAHINKTCFTGINRKIVSTYEPRKRMLTNSPACRPP
eukprot:6243308-Pyramimonas_sp.AAC.3